MAVAPAKYRGFRVTRGDATGEQLAILVPTDYRVLHIASAADEATDWNVANPTHPTLYVHSETTPATDYIAVSHDGTDGYINSVGGTLRLNGVTSLYLSIGGTNEITLTASAFSPTTTDGNALGTTALMWGDLFLASGGVINFDNGNATITHSAAVLAIAGADVTIASATGLNVGSVTQVTVSDGDGTTNLIPEVQALGVGTAFAGGAIIAATFNTTNTRAVSPKIILVKGGAATQVATTAVADNEVAGSIIAYGSDGTDFESPVAAIEFVVDDVSGPTTGQMGGSLEFYTTADAGETLTIALTLSNAQLATFAGGIQGNTRIDVGISGTTTGIIAIDGATSGTVTITAVAAAGTWTMTLPTGVAGTGGFQLTDASGDGVCTWAAASLGAWKHDHGILDPHEALEDLVRAPTHKFTYNPDVMPPGVWAPKDDMVGVFAEEAPWAMHGKRAEGNGIAFSHINSFGYARAAIQALYEDLQGARAEIVGLKEKLEAK